MIIKINPNDIPKGVTGKHVVRFRIVSVDQNRTSYWVYKEVEGIHQPAMINNTARFNEPPDKG